MGFPLMRLPRPIEDEPKPGYDFDPAKLKDKDSLLIEIGVEEMPHKDCQAVLAQAEQIARKLFKDAQFDHGDIKLYVTPRRVALLIDDVPAKQPDVETEARGPKKDMAKDADGNWSIPAQRFAEGKGATVDDIYFEKAGKDEYCFVKVTAKGRHIGEFLDEFFEKFMRQLNFGKSMGWEDTTVVFSRPVRWLVALHGDTVVPASWKLREKSEIGPERHVWTNRLTYGHRRLAEGAVDITSATVYADQLKSAQVIADRDARMEQLRTRSQEACKDLGMKPEEDNDLFEEICDLTEWPEPILGEIPEDALTLPEEIIITPMKVHQRYIPVRTDKGILSKHFLCVANGDHDDEGKRLIKEGNERVLNARLRDAKYFWDADIEVPLESFAKKLGGIVFHQKLGTVADKVERLRKLYPQLKDNLPSLDDRTIDQTLQLMKADLTTQMVGEFDSLEGVMGMLYAREQNINEAVANAILEHRLPRRAGDAMPESDLGATAGLLDRFDTLAGFFGVGAKVKGASDPFGLRRTALAVLTIINRKQLDIDLKAFTKAAIENYGKLIPKPDETLEAILNFFKDRQEVMLRDEGYPYDQVAAALASHRTRPLQVRRCLEAFRALSEQDVQTLAEQTKRIARIVQEPRDAVDQSLLDETEQPLHSLLQSSAPNITSAVEDSGFDKAFSELKDWMPVIETSFEKVMVNAKDDALRQNRHALLREVLHTIRNVADLTEIEKRDVA